MDLSIRGRTALVCASTAGLGLASAQALAAEGVRVVISGRRKELAEEIADGLPGAEAVAADFTAKGAAETLVAQARAQLEADIDIVVLNGPGPRPARALDIDDADLRYALETLLIFQRHVVAETVPAMRDHGWGRIVAIGSSSVPEPVDSLALSTVGRSALAGYLKLLANEVAPFGVTVNMVHPGRIDTARVRELDEQAAKTAGVDAADVAERMTAAIPLGRYGSPAEFGALVAFLCSQPAAYITGSALRCDGGALHSL